MGDELGDSNEFFCWEVELHVRCIFLEFVDKFLWRRAEDIVDLMDLVELVLSGKQGEQREHFEEDAADAPNVHLVAVVAVGHEAFGRSVPSSGNVFGERWLVE